MQINQGPVVFTITAHGLGHLTRTLLIVEKFHTLCPNVKIIISTSIARNDIERFLQLPFQYRQQFYEPGTLQKNCFELDPEATNIAYLDYSKTRKWRLQEEMDFLQQTKCVGLVSDIPSLPIRAAANLGIPAVGISNFTWDWILKPLFAKSTLASICEQLIEDYACGNLHLLLPFGPDASPFPVFVKAPLVARSARHDPKKVRKLLGIPTDDFKQLIVVCPGGWGPSNWGEINLDGCAAFRFIFVGDLPIKTNASNLNLPHNLIKGLTLPDLINAADLVIAKPGYGIASECLVHRTPLLAVDRPEFRETPLLMDQLKELAPCAQISLRDFFSGRWEPGVEEALQARTPWEKVPRNGAEIIVKQLRNVFSIGE